MPPANSIMLELGTTMPSFDLPDFGKQGEHGKNRVVSDELPKDRPVLIMFICNHCPFVIHIQDQLAAIGLDYADRVSVIAINSNDTNTHPADAPDKMTETATEAGFTFPYLFDESQDVARSFQAMCTPDFFLFDADQRLAYRGQLDESRPSSPAPTDGKNLRDAMDAILSGERIPEPQRPSLGCSIKWKPGNEPR